MVDRKEADALLRDVAGTEKRVREFLVYSHTGDHLTLWGVIWLVGFGGTHVLATMHLGRWIGPLWLTIDVIGAAGSALIATRSAKNKAGRGWVPMSFQPLLAVLATIAFGTLWSSLGHFGWREEIAFYPTLFGFLFFVAGLWAGRALAIGGVLVTALTLAGYYWTGAWFDVWMAFVGGGALIAGGFWLRS